MSDHTPSAAYPDRRAAGRVSGSLLILLTLILLLAAFLRMHRLGSVPPGIAYDEGQIVWDTIRVSQYGWFPAYNDSRAEPLARYLTGLLIAIGGRTIFTARLMNVFWGMLTVAMAYRAIVSLLWREPQRQIAGLVGAGVLAVLVTPIALTHFADRGTFMVVIMMTAIHFLAQAWRRNRRGWWAAAGFFLMGSVHTYTAAVFFPFTIIPILLHQAIFQFGELRARLRNLPFLLLGALPPLLWWLWQFSRPGPLYWRSADVGYERGRGLEYLITRLPRRLLATTQGFYALGDCDPQFNAWSKPLLNPLLFVLMLAGLALILWRFRRFEAAVLLTLLPVQLLPVALTIDVVHGRRIAGEFLVAAALIGLAAMKGWQMLGRWRGARLLAGAALAILLAGTGVDSLHSYLSYLTLEDETLASCDGNPMDPYYYYLYDHVDLARQIAAARTPVYLPIEELDVPAVHVTLAQQFPRVESFSTLAGAGERLDLPDGDVIVYPGQERTAHYALLLPGDRPARGRIILLPGLSPEARSGLETALRERGAIIPGRRSPKIGLRLPVAGQQNPFAQMATPIENPIALFANGMQLVAVDAPFVLIPGQPIDITLYWQAARPLASDYYSSVTLITPDGQGVANHYYWIMRWLYATAQWPTDQTVPDGHTLQVPADLAPGAYRLRVGVANEWFEPQPLPATGPNGEPLGEFFPLNYFKVPFPEPPPLPAEGVPTDITIGGLHLQGYTVRRNGAYIALRDARPGDTLEFTFYWDIPERLPGLYHLFLHVQESAQGDVIGGFDGSPLGDIYPTIVWGPDERVVTTHTITLPEKEGLQFRLGLYEWPSLERLPVVQDEQRVPDDRAVLLGE